MKKLHLLNTLNAVLREKNPALNPFILGIGEIGMFTVKILIRPFPNKLTQFLVAETLMEILLSIKICGIS